MTPRHAPADRNETEDRPGWAGEDGRAPPRPGAAFVSVSKERGGPSAAGPRRRGGQGAAGGMVIGRAGDQGNAGALGAASDVLLVLADRLAAALGPEMVAEFSRRVADCHSDRIVDLAVVDWPL